MPKKKDTAVIKQEEIIQKTMEDVMHDSMIPYSEHVILERALPRVEDGLKPVQRRILFTMQELGNTFDKPHRKCARIVGDCLGKYHPHGDSSVYDALTRLAQPFVMRAPLVDGHGNFGSVDGDSPAAMRYTEARMTELAMYMLNDIEKDTVDFHLNFDDTLKEPDLLPAAFPNLLVNGTNGIAVGLATSIPPHNLGEVIDGAVALIDKPDMTTAQLMKYIPAPDFPTGGILSGGEELLQAYETGKGKIQVRAKVHIEDSTAGRKLIVMDELPYQVNKAAMLEKILHLSEEKKPMLNGIYDIRDESDRMGMRAVVEVRKDADPEKILNVLYKYSDMQVTFAFNMVAIAEGKPVLMGLKKMLSYYIQHRKNVVTRRTQYDLQQAEARAHILEGLIIAVDNLDEVIRLIRSSKTPKEAKEKLMKAFQLTDVQAQAILDMRLQRLTNLEILSLRKEYEELQKRIAEFREILANEKKLMNVIKKELKAVREKFADPRRTVIAEGFAPIVIETQEEEPDEITVFLTAAGMIKRMARKNFEKSQGAGEFADPPVWIHNGFTNDRLLFFTDRANCFALTADAISESKPKDRGTAPGGLLAGLEKDEKLVRILPAGDWNGEIVLATESGMIKRVELQELNVRKSGYSVMKMKDNDHLIMAEIVGDYKDILQVTRLGMAIHFNLEEVSVLGRSASGVKSMKLESGDSVIASFLHRNEGEIVVATELGYMKRCLLVDFDRQSRGGKGSRCITLLRNGKNGSCLVGARLVTDPYDLRVTQKNGMITPVNTDSIAIEKSSSKGTPYILVSSGNEVTGIE